MNTKFDFWTAGSEGEDFLNLPSYFRYHLPLGESD
jgi:hypothetical protein